MAGKKDFSELVDRVIREADILLMIIDSRRIAESINMEVVSKIRRAGKRLLFIINKCDLLSEEEQKKLNDDLRRRGKQLGIDAVNDTLQMSAKKHWGTIRLLKKIMLIGKGNEVTVGVVGFPNTGKSSIINALKGRHSAPTSSISGYTKGLQKIRVSGSVLMIDTPGVIPYGKRDFFRLVEIGAVDSEKVKDPEATATKMIEDMDGKIEDFFGVQKLRQGQDALEVLEKIALKNNALLKGGFPDTARMGRRIIALWQKGEIR